MLKQIIIALTLWLCTPTMQAQASPRYTRMQQLLKSLHQPADMGAYDTAMCYVDDQLDFCLLGTSPQWQSTIGQWVAAHETFSTSHKVFELQLASAAKKIIERTLPDIGTAERFVRTLAPLADSLGVEAMMPSLAVACYGMDIPLGDTNVLANRMLTAIRLIDSNAPLLANREYDELQNCLLLFFDSGCDGCQQMVNLLLEQYPILQQKGIRVVSVAADLSPENFKANCGHLPWDSYCSYIGFKGDNFVNYGVASVPTLYYIDKQGIVKEKYYRVEDVKNALAWLVNK